MPAGLHLLRPIRGHNQQPQAPTLQRQVPARFSNPLDLLLSVVNF
jgi:hypothetical protein